MNDPVVVLGAHDLAGIGERAASAATLVLFGCHVKSLAGVEKLSKLRDLRVLCSTVEDLSALSKCNGIEDVEIAYCAAEDASPLLEMPSLRRAKLFGNPWSKASFEEVQPKLAAAKVKKWKRPAIAEWDDEHFWQMNLLLKQKGLDVSAGSPFSVGAAFVKRGAEKSGEVLWFTDVLFMLREALEASPKKQLTYDDLKTTLSNALFDTTGDWKKLDAASGYALCDKDDVLESLKTSDLPAAQRAGLSKFVERFPGQQFLRYGSRVLDKVEETAQIKLPPWYRRIMEEGVASVIPEWNSFEALCDGKWLRLGPMGYHGRDQKKLFRDQARIFPVAENDAGDKGCALALDHPDVMELIEYDQNVMNDQLDGDQPVRGVKGPESYSALLGSATAIRVGGKEIDAAG